MRGLRSTIALIVVLAGLGAYIYFVTWKKPEGDTGEEDEKVFAGVQADKIDELRITSAGGDVTTLKKDNGAWQVAAAGRGEGRRDRGLRASRRRWRRIDIVRVIDENPSNLNDYGLSNPRIEVDFKAAGDKDYRKLLIGEKSPTGADLFAKRNDEKRVFLIPAFQETTFNKDTFELRDKSVLKFDRDKVDGVEVDRGRQDAGDGQGRRGLEDHEAARDARRLRIGRRAGRPGADGADEVDRRRSGDARPI